MKQRSLGINAILNIIRTILALIAPLITYPYVSRVLGVSNLGSVNYTNSIIQYFVLFSGLGISTYGIREGAKIRDKQKKLDQFLGECFTINIIFTVIAYVLLIVLVNCVKGLEGYKLLFIIQSFLIIFNTIGIEWVNTVFEDYFYITIRTILVQIVSIILTFGFIHGRNDYYKYAIITVATTGFISILNWFHCKKQCNIKIRKISNYKIHLKSIFIFFANKLAVTLYVSSDTTMLGAMTSDYYVGIYGVAVKIYTIVKNMTSALYVVFIPRLSYKVGNCANGDFKNLYSKLICIMTLLIFPASAGVFVLSDDIVYLLFGQEYARSSISLSILSVALIFAIYGGLVSAVYNVVKGLEKISLQATIIAAVVNMALNFVLIPYYKEVGASLTTLLAELMTFAYCAVKAKGIKADVNFRLIAVCLIHAFVGCGEIFVIHFTVSKFVQSSMAVCCICVVASIAVYAMTLVVFRNKFVLEYVNAVKNKIFQK